MRRVAYLWALVLACGWAGCTPPPERMSHYPPPIFTTKPRRAEPVPQAPVQVQRPVQPRRVDFEPGWIPPRGLSNRWTDIVIHHSATSSGSARVFDDYHRNVRNWDELGYHFVIGNGTHSGDGQIEVGSRWTKQKHGAHCKTLDNYYNDHGIGICLVGDFNKTYPTQAQLAGLNKLLAFLTQECGILPSRINTHGGVTHKTECPGRHFSLAVVKRNLALSRSVLSRGGTTP